MKESESLKATLSAVFKRKGRNGLYTRLFEDLEPVQQDVLLKNVQLNEGELPVIGSVESQDKWLMITTKRIVWSQAGKTQALTVQDIRDAVADLHALKTNGRTKLQMRELQIQTMSHAQHTIEVEEGAPLSGVWNALKNLGARNRRKG
jgi:hypothetical protein